MKISAVVCHNHQGVLFCSQSREVQSLLHPQGVANFLCVNGLAPIIEKGKFYRIPKWIEQVEVGLRSPGTENGTEIGPKILLFHQDAIGGKR